MQLPSKNWVEIDLSAIAHNFRTIRRRIGPGAGIIGVVKSDAYGHGSSRVGRLLESLGIEMLAVASVEEGIVLRERGIGTPILVLGCVFREEVEALLRHSLTPNLCNTDVAGELSRCARSLGRVARVHVKIDTGLGSLGVHYREAAAFIGEAASTGGLFIEGIFTHFSSSSEIDNIHTYEQLRIFRDVLREIEGRGIHIPLRHVANSGAILGTPEALLFNMVRPGMLLYGLCPLRPGAGREKYSVGVRPAMTLKTRLGFIKELSAGETVSYGRTFRASRRTRVGILPMGYDNGYIRALSNKGRVVIRGQYAPVIGRIRMNHVQVDVTDIPGVSVGDTVELFGGQSGLSVSAEEVAEQIGTVPYEIVCASGRSNPRVYTNEVARDEHREEGPVYRSGGSVPLYKG